MNDPQTTTSPHTLIVVGASGRIGREVARLGVAYGAEVIGITRHGHRNIDEPWVAGVTWIARDFADDVALADLPRGVLVIAAPVPVPVGATDTFSRVIVVASDSSAAAAGITVARPGEVDDSPLDDFGTLDAGKIRVETLGMALLRAAFDEGIATDLDPAALAILGDAVMLQASVQQSANASPRTTDD